MLQLQFLDKNVIDALVPAFSVKPDEIIFMYDKDKTADGELSSIETAITHRMPQTKVRFIGTRNRLLGEMKTEILNVIYDYKPEDVQVDMSGGWEYMIACGLAVCEEFGCIPTYFDHEDKLIYNQLTDEVICEAADLTIDDYMLAVGARRLDNPITAPPENEWPRYLKQAEIVLRKQSAWHMLQRHIVERTNSMGDEVFTLESSIKKDGNVWKLGGLIQSFIDNGFLIKREDGKYSFADKRARDYLKIYGVWLEAATYIQAGKFFHEAYFRFLIDWDGRKEDMALNNEIDVLAAKEYYPVFISCKMTKPTSMDIYEAAFLAKRLGGSSGKAIIATTYDVLSEKDKPTGIYNRFQKMGVGFIRWDDMKQSPNKAFRKAFNAAK